MIHTQDDSGTPGVHTTPTNKHTREQHKKKTADIKTSLQRRSVSQWNYQPLIKHLLTRKETSFFTTSGFISLPPPQSVQPEDLFTLPFALVLLIISDLTSSHMLLFTTYWFFISHCARSWGRRHVTEQAAWRNTFIEEVLILSFQVKWQFQ